MTHQNLFNFFSFSAFPDEKIINNIIIIVLQWLGIIKIHDDIVKLVIVAPPNFTYFLLQRLLLADGIQYNYLGTL